MSVPNVAWSVVRSIRVASREIVEHGPVRAGGCDAPGCSAPEACPGPRTYAWISSSSTAVAGAIWVQLAPPVAPRVSSTGTHGPMDAAAIEMAAEVAAGNAVRLSERITDFVRLRSKWWILDRDGWFDADDEELIASLDAAVPLMAPADGQVGRKP
jgi:hypothetical protein